MPRVVTWATFEIKCRQILRDDAEEVLNSCIDCHPIVQFQIERNLIFEMCLEVGPISVPEIGAFRWVMKGRTTRTVIENREVVGAYCSARGQIHWEREFLRHRNV
jgi:hypothetical protein